MFLFIFAMLLFILASLSVILIALVLVADTEKGVLVVSPRVWFLVIAGLGVWLVVLAA